MAVTFDNKGVTTGAAFSVTTVSTGSFTVGSGANRAGAVGISFASTAPTSILADIGGTSGAVVTGTDTTTNGSAQRSLIYGVINPPAGSKTATASWSNGTATADIGAWTVTNCDQTTPLNNGTFTHSNAVGTTASLSVTSTNGDLTITMGSCWGDSITATPTNQTLTWGPDSSSVVAGDRGPGTGTTTHTWTTTNTTQDRIISGASFKQFVASGDTQEWLGRAVAQRPQFSGHLGY